MSECQKEGRNGRNLTLKENETKNELAKDAVMLTGENAGNYESGQRERRRRARLIDDKSRRATREGKGRIRHRGKRRIQRMKSGRGQRERRGEGRENEGERRERMKGRGERE